MDPIGISSRGSLTTLSSSFSTGDNVSPSTGIIHSLCFNFAALLFLQVQFKKRKYHYITLQCKAFAQVRSNKFYLTRDNVDEQYAKAIAWLRENRTEFISERYTKAPSWNEFLDRLDLEEKKVVKYMVVKKP